MSLLDELERAGSKRHASEGAVEDAFIETRQEPDALRERLAKVEFAAHGTLGNLGDTVANARLLAEEVDDLLVDERGVDIHDDKAAGGGVRVGRCHLCHGFSSVYRHVGTVLLRVVFVTARFGNSPR